MLELIPVQPIFNENREFAENPDCLEILQMTLDYYKIIGFTPPWICYFAKLNGVLAGSAGYKGKPVNNRIEIAYGTFPAYQKQGIGTEICKQLVLLARQTAPEVIITARTMEKDNFSAKILQKNRFKLNGSVWDTEDGEVWEWQYED